jgi:hypothetical protein
MDNETIIKAINNRLVEYGEYSDYLMYVDEKTMRSIGMSYKNSGWVVYMHYTVLGGNNIILICPQIVENHEYVAQCML